MKFKMVAALAAVVACVCLMTCGYQRHEAPMDDAEEEVTDSLITDSMLAEADTLLLDKETALIPLPTSVDEFFSDFIFNFDQSNRLQRNRIHFPLLVKEADGNEHYIQRRDWKHHNLFMQQEYSIVLWNTSNQMELAQDTSLTCASVEQIYLHSRQITAFLFERDSVSRQWMLTRQHHIPFERSELGSFLDFYRQFATDSIFQRQHVSNPLRFATTDDEDGFNIIRGTINADQWFEFQPEMPQDVLTNIHYGQSYHNHNQILMQMRGINNGLENLFTFHREGAHWHLIAFEN